MFTNSVYKNCLGGRGGVNRRGAEGRREGKVRGAMLGRRGEPNSGLALAR
jgi:hypothetical protein